MEKMWTGRFAKQLDKEADDFNSSIAIDGRMYRQDIEGSLAHAQTLVKQGILSVKDGCAIAEGLTGILADLDSGALQIDPAAEDIHMFIEGVLTQRIGEAGKRLHTARSRNDQVALDTRLYLRKRTAQIQSLIKELIGVICKKAETYADTVMPGYTHLQRAQPVTFGHHLLAYGMMLSRDLGRLSDAAKRMNQSPLGCCALAGTTYPTDRAFAAEALGFDGYTLNSIDGVSDRDFCIELESALALVMAHLSRFAEEIILWCSWEFQFVELDDAFTTGSSIMPQKKNADMAELVRGKTGRVYGNLMAALTMLKGLPLAYNKDMQEDKEAVFDSFDTVEKCLTVFTPMLDTMQVHADKMKQAALGGYINATDLADYLTKKGVPFRTAYKLTGELVALCIRKGCPLDVLSLEEYQKYSELFEPDLYEEIALETCVKKRTSAGGPGADSIRTQIKFLHEVIA